MNTYARFNQPVLRRRIEPGQYTSGDFCSMANLEGLQVSFGSTGTVTTTPPWRAAHRGRRYNRLRHHGALGHRTPVEFAATFNPDHRNPVPTRRGQGQTERLPGVDGCPPQGLLDTGSGLVALSSTLTTRWNHVTTQGKVGCVRAFLRPTRHSGEWMLSAAFVAGAWAVLIGAVGCGGDGERSGGSPTSERSRGSLLAALGKQHDVHGRHNKHCGRDKLDDHAASGKPATV